MFCYQHTEVQNKDKEIFFVTSIVGYIWQDEAVNYGIEYSIFHLLEISKKEIVINCMHEMLAGIGFL